MKLIDLKGIVREAVGKKNCREVRANNGVPCVLYGGEKNVHFSVDEKELKSVVYTPHVYIVTLEIDGQRYESIMKDLQFHPVSEAVLHVDFLQLSETKDVIVRLPVELSGFAVGVKSGGKLVAGVKYLRLKGRAKNFPDILKIDVTNLELGKSIKVSDLKFENIEILDQKNTVLATVQLTRAAKNAPVDEKAKDAKPAAKDAKQPAAKEVKDTKEAKK